MYVLTDRRAHDFDCEVVVVGPFATAEAAADMREGDPILSEWFPPTGTITGPRWVVTRMLPAACLPDHPRGAVPPLHAH